MAPNAPTALRYQEDTSTSLVLIWSAPGEDGASLITEYAIRQSSDSGSTWSAVPSNRIVRSSANSLNAKVIGLTAGTSYMFQVAAVNAIGTSPWSVSSVEALAASDPSKATSVYVTGKTGTTVSLGWAAPDANGLPITSYVIEYSDATGALWNAVPVGQRVQNSPTSTSATITGLTQGQAYSFRVAAVNARGTGVPTVIGEPVIPATKPLTPSSVAIGAKTTSSISLTWNAPASDGGRPLIGYDVQQSTDQGTTWVYVDTAWITRASLASLSVTVRGLNVGRYYTFRTRAVNGEGAGDWSVQSPVARAAEIPQPITTLQSPLDNAGSPDIRNDSINLFWSAPNAMGSAITSYALQVSSDNVNWGGLVTLSSDAFAYTISGLQPSQERFVRIAAINGEGQANWSASYLARTKPAAPANIVIGARTADSISFSWSAPVSNGVGTLNRYDVQQSNDQGSTWSNVDSAWISRASLTSLSATVRGLDIGQYYMFRVRAVNAEGSSDWSTPSVTARAATPPGAVSTLHIPLDSFGDPDLQDDSINVVWSPAPAMGSPLTGYSLQVSSDGRNWGNSIALGGDVTSYTIAGLKPSQSRLIRIEASNGEGQGPWSIPYLATTGGLAQMLVSVVDESGMPVTGGAITWRMDDGSAKSSITYGLTADGIIQFPGAPAGAVTVTLKNAQMNDGSIVSGVWHATLGFNKNELVVPNPPKSAAHKVHVILSNGPALSNVAVDLESADGFSNTISSGDFTYKVVVTPSSGFTDTNGDFTVVGYTGGDVSVRVNYDDGIISQTKQGLATGPVTTVKLRSLPFATFDSTSVQGTVGVPVPVVVSAGTAMTSSGMRGLRNTGGTLRNAVTGGLGNVKVTLVPPKGSKVTGCASSKIKQVLTGITDTKGKVKLSVCPQKSGVYTLKTRGALSVGAVNILVKGAPPLPVNSVTVKSLAPGSIHASWAKPIYDGGSPITSYVITMSAQGKPTITKTLNAVIGAKGKVTKAPATVIDVNKLANATVYTVTIKAVTALGTGDSYTTKIPVA